MGALLVRMAWGFEIGIQAGIQGKAPVIPKPGIDVMAWTAMMSTLCASAWGVLFTWQKAKPLLHIGEAQGIGLRRSAIQGYVSAVILAVVLTAVGLSLEKLFPPDVAKLTGPLEQLARGHGWPQAVYMLIALCIAPPLEEFIFRGALYAALSRFGMIAATLLTTLVFMLFHMADKIHYLPGFIPVGLLSLFTIYLRLRYRSLWPAIVLHFLYNAALILLT
ncbi:MAG: CPBP family intramembrane metalloprotease [Gammaproteobacteria bacterium]|nr:CPBP family intramembrane metalloprotease [Gammaproteobacteria bacterium]MDE2344877.1 CPBP family intramembrane metalloprotease [Gammaproteobacteria bacterium]